MTIKSKDNLRLSHPTRSDKSLGIFSAKTNTMNDLPIFRDNLNSKNL